MGPERIDVAGTWWRQIPGGGDVHYRPEHAADGRWQRGSVVEALYFADEPDTAWAEWYRFLAEAAIPPQAALPRDLWCWNVDAHAVADLSDEGRLERAGLPVPAPGRALWPAFQAVGEAVYADGYAGLIAPSAARPANLILCLFREQRIVPGTEPAPPPEHHEFPPLVPTGLTT